MAAPKKKRSLSQTLDLLVKNQKEEFKHVLPWCVLFLHYLNINENYEEYRQERKNISLTYCAHVVARLECKFPLLNWIYKNFAKFKYITSLNLGFDDFDLDPTSRLFDVDKHALVKLFYTDIPLYYRVSSSLIDDNTVIESLGKKEQSSSGLKFQFEAPVFKNKQTLIDLITAHVNYYYENIIENQGNREQKHSTIPLSKKHINLVLPAENNRNFEKLLMALDVFRLKNHADNIGAKSAFSTVISWFDSYLFGSEPLIEIYIGRTKKNKKTIQYFPDMTFCAEWIKSDLPSESAEDKVRDLYKTAESVVDNILSGIFPMMPATKAQKRSETEHNAHSSFASSCFK